MFQVELGKCAFEEQEAVRYCWDINCKGIGKSRDMIIDGLCAMLASFHSVRWVKLT